MPDLTVRSHVIGRFLGGFGCTGVDRPPLNSFFVQEERDLEGTDSLNPGDHAEEGLFVTLFVVIQMK